MKQLDIGDNIFWILVWGVIGTVLATIVFFVCDYNTKANLQILNAPTCEKAIILQGGADVTARLYACKIKAQSLQEEPNTGK